MSRNPERIEVSLWDRIADESDYQLSVTNPGRQYKRTPENLHLTAHNVSPVEGDTDA